MDQSKLRPDRRDSLIREEKQASSSISRGQKVMSIKFELRRFILGALVLSLVVLSLSPNSSNSAVEAAKKGKEKKIIKSLVKGLIFKNLSTKKNILPMPVPIPVPIELTEPPIYLRGKTRYVDVYRPAPKPKPTPRPVPVIVKPTTVYHIPALYSPSYDVLQDYDVYRMIVSMANRHRPASSYSTSLDHHSVIQKGYGQNSAYDQAEFTDFDDEPSANKYQLRKASSNNSASSAVSGRIGVHRRSSAISTVDGGSEHKVQEHKRVKRQVYESSYDREPACYGFPLEINIRSRIKMDQMFPIYGKSQIKKCVKFPPPPLFPPIRDDYPRVRPPY